MASSLRVALLPLLILCLNSAAAFADGVARTAEPEACSRLVAVPQSPAGGATVPALVTFRWRGPDLDSLRLPFDLHPRYQVYVWRAGERRTFAGETTETALTRFLEPGTWFWSVVGVVSGCTPRPAAAESFVIESRAECPSAGPSLISPAAGERVEGSRTTLQWSAVDGADVYQVWLRRDPDAPFRGALTRKTEAELELPAGVFGWRVAALVGGCGAILSDPSAFVVARCGLRPPVLLTPTEGTSGIGSTVLFAWSRVPGAITYRLWARAERSLPDSEPSLIAETTQPFHLGTVPETTVVSTTGRVTVYASRVDNRTGDPFVAHPVVPEAGRKWVVPGVADLDTGQASWRTDLRIHNAGDEPVEATLSFYPQVSPGQIPSASVANLEVAPGETAAIDDVLATQWGLANVGGAIHVTTESDAELVVTAQTYDLSEIGTYGQFIPAVLQEEAVGLGGRTLQVQIEESDRFRTNLGLAEVSGEAVTLEISAVVPESRVIPKATITLAANEFRQIVQVIKALNLPSTYNGRIAVRVTEGAGKVAAYASMVDNVTQDPTYVPGQ